MKTLYRGYVCGPEVIQLQENWPLFEKLSGWLIVIKKKNDIGSYFANVFFPAVTIVVGAMKHLISFPMRFNRFIPLPPSFHLALTKIATDRKITNTVKCFLIKISASIYLHESVT